MNKYLKGCLIVSGIVIILSLIFVGIIYYQTSTSRARNNADDLECSNNKYIADHTLIIISDSLAAKNVNNIKVYLVKNAQKIDSAEFVNNFEDRIEFTLPFKKAPLSSNILIKTERHEFLITNMKYFNDAKWGMFGYLGKNCQFDYTYKKLK